MCAYKFHMAKSCIRQGVVVMIFLLKILSKIYSMKIEQMTLGLRRVTTD